MIIRSISGDAEINHAMTLAMHATLDALVADKSLTHKEAIAFADTHVIIMVTNDDVFSRIRKWFKPENDGSRPLVFKCVTQEKPSDEAGQDNGKAED